MDALDLLEEHHREVLVLLDGVASEARPGARAKLTAALVRHVEVHLSAEARHLYAVCAERLAGREHQPQLRDAWETHALVRFAAGNLLQTRATDVRFASRLKLLRCTFVDHARTEEASLFQRAKTELTDEQLDAIGERIARSCELARDDAADRDVIRGRGRRTRRRSGRSTA
jgi:hemerythrin superfamily protein